MNTTTEPTTICTCGTGPFFFVPAREFPHLCTDCAENADREANGWTPFNSRD